MTGTIPVLITISSFLTFITSRDVVGTNTLCGRGQKFREERRRRTRRRQGSHSAERGRAGVACGWMASLGKFAAHPPTLCILAGDKYHMELRGSPLECAGPRAHRNVSLQMENVRSC